MVKHLPYRPGDLYPHDSQRRNWFHKVWPLHTCHDVHDHTPTSTHLHAHLKKCKEGEEGREERKVRQNKDYPTPVITAAGHVCGRTVMFHTVFEIPAAENGSPFTSQSCLSFSRPFPPWPTHWRALESPSKALDWTVLQCPVQIPARSKSSITVSTQSGPSLRFLRLSALTSVGGSLLCCSCISYWVFSTSGWAKVLSRQGTSLLVILLPDSLSSYAVVKTLDLVLNDGEDSLKALRYLEKPRTQQQKPPQARISKCELPPVLVRAARKRKINSGTSQKLECIDSHNWKVEA